MPTYNGRPFPLFVAEQARDLLASLAASTLDGDAPDTLEELSALLSGDMRRAVDHLERVVADKLPPIRAADARTLANDDREIAREVEAYRDGRYSFVDVTDLAGTGDEDVNGDTWEIVAGGSSRYEVREVPRYEARDVAPKGEPPAWRVWDTERGEMYEDDFDPSSQEEAERRAAELADGEVCWIVWDTDTDARDGDRYSPLRECSREDYDPTDEDDARAAADAANLEDYRTNACGWPFAHNYAAEIEEWEAEDFAAAGFVVARYKGDTYYAGIDGGGYDFTSHHWAPLFLRRMAEGGSCVRTSKGLRRAVE